MSGSPVEPILESAQRAASSGDYALAESLLREVARLQADRLGPQHPDLASTFNNLGVVCERANNLLDAGKFYRQALSIASGCLDADHPLVVTSRNNFNEFHRVLGLVDTAASPHVDVPAPAGELEDSLRKTAERAHDANIFATAPPSTSMRLAIVPGIATAGRAPRRACDLVDTCAGETGIGGIGNGGAESVGTRRSARVGVAVAGERSLATGFNPDDPSTTGRRDGHSTFGTID
jgi:hypothetical protein